MKGVKGQIEQQYQNLKHKVQSEIQALQKKLSHNTQIHYHRTINSNPNNKTLLQPSTSSQYQYHKPSQHYHHHNCHNHSTHSSHSCCYSHCGGGMGRSGKSSMSGEELTPANSRTMTQHIPVSTLLQPPPHPPVNIPLVNTKILEHNLFLQQAFIKSIHTQQQMAENMRLLQQKIAKLQQNPHSNLRSNHTSQESQNQYQFRTHSSGSDEVRHRSVANEMYQRNYERVQGRRDGQGYRVVLNEYLRGRWEGSDDVQLEDGRDSSRGKGVKSRDRNGSSSNVKSSHSIKSKKSISSNKKIKSSKNISFSINNPRPSSTSRANKKPPKNKSSHNLTNNQYLLNPNQHHKTLLSPKNPKPLLIKNQQWSDYYSVDGLCPVHINPAEIRLRSKDKEVYVDSQHRNRKHERDHLVESFKQQDIARKKLVEKIIKSSTGITINLMNK